MPPSTREVFVKVSGITNLDDAKYAVKCRVDAIGLVLSPGEPCSLRPEECLEIVKGLPSHISKVGEFAGGNRQYLSAVLSRVHLSAAQIDGPFGADDLVDFETSVIKVFHVGRDFDIEVMRNYLVDAFLLDACDEEVRDSRERVFRWDAAARATSVGRVILSGGLTPENVAEAVRFVRPFGVDVSAGDRSKAEQLDRARLREFVARAKSVRLIDDESDLSDEYP